MDDGKRRRILDEIATDVFTGHSVLKCNSTDLISLLDCLTVIAGTY